MIKMVAIGSITTPEVLKEIREGAIQPTIVIKFMDTAIHQVTNNSKTIMVKTEVKITMFRNHGRVVEVVPRKCKLLITEPIMALVVAKLI